MAWNDWVVKHAKGIVIAWIIVILLATPLAMKLKDVTNYSMDQFLPKDVESVRVQDTLQSDFPSFANSTNQTYMIISGIDVNSPEARKAYERLKVEAKPYGSNFVSYYDAVDLLQNKSDDIALNLTKTAANLTGVLYETALNSSAAYGEALIGIERLDNQVEELNSTLPQLARAYIELNENLTELYNQSMALSTALNETDGSYVVLHKNLTEASDKLRTLNSTLSSLNAELYNLSDDYERAYLGVMGTYGALLKAGAYSKGSLDSTTAEAVSGELGVPVEFVYTTFNATYPVYAAKGPAGITDTLLANVTEGIVSESAKDPMEKSFIRAYGIAFYRGVEAFDGKAGSDYALLNLGENAAKPVHEIASEALSALPDVIKAAGGTFDVPGFGKVPAETLSEVVKVAVGLGRNPSPAEVENATVSTAGGLFGGRYPRSLLTALLKEEPTEKLEESLLTEGLKEKLPAEQKSLAPIIAGTVVKFDPHAEGTLSKNPALLENATVQVLSEILKSRGVELPENVIKEVYESGGNVEPIAVEILTEKTTEKVKDEKTAKVIVDVVRKNAEELAEGRGVKDAVKEIVTRLAGETEFDLSRVIDELYAGKTPREIALELFREGIDEKLSNVSAPADVKEAIRKVALTVAEKYPMGEVEMEKLAKEEAAGIIAKHLNDNDLGVELHIDTAKLVNIAFKFREDPDAITKDDVKPISAEIYPTLYNTAKDYIEMLKSMDNRTMLVLFTPKGLKGVSDLEKASRAQYENSLKVKELALKEFGKSFNGVKAYITGTPVQTYEAIKYGKEDNDKTTKFSVVGALIVLLILMGVALLATLLPFTGVATATLTALGILYLLAKGDVVDVGSWAQMLTVTTALGLGIDYSTYYLHRFREYLAEGYDHDGAASEALKRAKDAVLASASTDIIAFASFILAWEFPIFKTMGIIAPLAVITVLVASLTFIPAITVLIGDKPVFWWPRHIEHHLRGVDLHERSRIAEWAVRHAKVAVLIALLVAVPAAYNFASFHGTHDIKLFIPKDSETYHFLQLSDKTVGAGVSSPTYVVIDLGHKVTPTDLSKINAIAGEISKVSGVEHVYTLTQPYGKRINTEDIDALKSLGGDRYLSKDESKVLIQVTGKYEATDERSKEMVREIRSIVKNEEKKGTIESGMVGGNTALALDLSNLINDVFWHRIFPVALLLMFLSLIPTLKGIPAVIATMGTIAVGVLLSISVSSWLFERVFGQQVMWFLPLMVFIVLMGVGIDYNSFYLVKARDEFERRKPEDALVVAAGTMDKLVVGLAAVLAATYSSLMTGATWGIREIGFALALGVLLTATLAVYFIGPSTMALFGEKAWWPLHRAEKKD